MAFFLYAFLSLRKSQCAGRDPSQIANALNLGAFRGDAKIS